MKICRPEGDASVLGAEDGGGKEAGEDMAVLEICI